MENTIQLIPVEQKISQGLQAFETKKKELAELASTSKGLVVTDINNKQELEAVSTARKKLKAERVSIEKQAKELRDNIIVISKNISAKEKELIAIISPTEDALQAEEKRVEDAKEYALKEVERIEQERIKARVKILIDNGCVYDGVNYSIADCCLNDAQLKVMEDGIFTIFLDRAKIEHTKYLKELEEATQRDLKEALRIEKEKKKRRLV